MLYLLLYPLHNHYVGFGVLRYETFRSVMAGLAALALSLALGPILIDRFRAAHIGQTIRDEVPQAHQKKAGTPTMGGLLILVFVRRSRRSCSPTSAIFTSGSRSSSRSASARSGSADDC